MYFDDYGNKYKTIEDAEKGFAKRFDEEIMNNIENFSEMLWYFSDLSDILKILCEKDKTILNILKNHYSKEFEEEKREYIKEKMAYDLEEF